MECVLRNRVITPLLTPREHSRTNAYAANFLHDVGGSISTGGIVRDWSFLQVICLGVLASGYSLQLYGMQLFRRAGLIGRSDESSD